jgi:hypothetical protein
MVALGGVGAANVQKENSNVRQTLRMLLLAVKTLQDAPPSPASVPSSPALPGVNYTPGKRPTAAFPVQLHIN